MGDTYRVRESEVGGYGTYLGVYIRHLQRPFDIRSARGTAVCGCVCVQRMWF
jgi:hypothetical protein